MIGGSEVRRDSTRTCRRQLQIVLLCEVLRGVANFEGEVVGASLGHAVPKWKS